MKRHPPTSGAVAVPTLGANGVPTRAVLLSSPRAGSAGRIAGGLKAIAAAGIEIVEQILIEDHERLDDWVARDEPAMVIAAGVTARSAPRPTTW